MSVNADDILHTYDMPYVSDCCGVEVYCDIDICSSCKDHCTVVNYEEEDGEYNNNTSLKFKYQ